MTIDLPIYFNSDEPAARGNLTQFSQQQQPQVHLTSEEVRLLRECNRESFYYRCIPFAFTAMAGTYLAVQKGFLKPHPKYGSVFKQMGAGFVGWLVGKLSYRRACEEKFLQLQNSSLGDAIRKKHGLSLEKFHDSSAQSNDIILITDDVTQFSSDKDYHSSYGALNLDTDKNAQYSDLDERTALDNEYILGSTDISSESNTRRPTITYDELRRRNRAEHTKQSLPPASPTSKWDSYRSPVKRENQKDEGSGSVKNTYGDTWEK